MRDRWSRRADGTPRGRSRWLVPLLAPLVAVLTVVMAGFWIQVPQANRFVERSISTELAASMACAGGSGKPLKVRLGGGPILPQLLRRRLDRIEISTPDLSVGDLKHASVRATLRDVSRSGSGAIRVGKVDASITMGFADLPAEQDGRPVKISRSPDGLVAIDTVREGGGAKGTVFSKLELRGASLAAVPQRLKIFGRTIPARQAADRIGGARVQPLPPLPAGVSYQSIRVEGDGLHVSLGGTVTTPLTKLPAEVNGRKVSYEAVNGTLAISPEVNIPLIGNLPVTIFAAPELDGESLAMVPRSVTVLGRNRPPDDPIAKTVLGQVDQKGLTRELPALPKGVRYQSAAVDSEGVKVRLGGVTIRPFSALPAEVEGRATTYGAAGGLLTATAADGRPTRVELFAKPTITGNVLEMVPQQIRIFGALFPASAVFAEIKPPDTKRELQALPASLSYRGAEVVPEGLRITIGGAGVQVDKKQSASCGPGKSK